MSVGKSDKGFLALFKMVKLVLQRCKSGSVTVDGKIIGQIGKGIVVLVGIHRDDKPEDLEWAIQKMLNYCMWPAEDEKPWRKSVMDIDGELLLVSQFTLYARPNGRKPDFSHSMGPEGAEQMYNMFVEQVKAKYKADKIQTGSFGAMMDVALVNDGPVTMIFDTLNKKG